MNAPIAPRTLLSSRRIHQVASPDPAEMGAELGLQLHLEQLVEGSISVLPAASIATAPAGPYRTSWLAHLRIGRR